MKKKNSTNLALSIIIAVFALVAILCCMAPGFDELARGTVYQIMFGVDDWETSAVPGLIVVFIFEIFIFVISLVAAFIKTKARSYIDILLGAMGLANAILLLFCRELYCGSNSQVINSGATALEFGSGFIVLIIFNLLIVIVSLLLVYLSKRKED